MSNANPSPIPLANLLLDERNARIIEEQPNQTAAMLALAEQQGVRLLRLAEHIVDHGIDPLTISAVYPSPDVPGKYVVIEGNRRLCALKALENPALVAPVLTAAQQTTLRKLADRFAAAPVHEVRCMIFDSEEAAIPWVVLRHSGQVGGVGLVEWGGDERDRFLARHGEKKQRSPAGQVIDFVEQHGTLSNEARASRQRVISSIDRIVNTRTALDTLGLEIKGRQVYSWYPASEVAKGLSKIMEDLKTRRRRMSDVYHKEDREEYIRSLPLEDLPDPTTRLPEPVPLETVHEIAPGPARPKPRKQRKPARPPLASPSRETMIPSDLRLNVTVPRLYQLYWELHNLKLRDFPSACSVLLRVFLELSLDHYLYQHGLLKPGQTTRGMPLAKKMKDVASHLRAAGHISLQLEQAIETIANSTTTLLAAGAPTLHAYVHNTHIFPKGEDLRVAWDELQPFFQALWP